MPRPLAPGRRSTSGCRPASLPCWKRKGRAARACPSRTHPQKPPPHFSTCSWVCPSTEFSIQVGCARRCTVHGPAVQHTRSPMIVRAGIGLLASPGSPNRAGCARGGSAQGRPLAGRRRRFVRAGPASGGDGAPAVLMPHRSLNRRTASSATKAHVGTSAAGGR